ncbi:MAG: SDR family NAD(P)-dependent oxidoreductase, partial [Pararhodobacter sp.]|nr:SDR family NAD(P)-dependent oxidoreductase [Pararhodobacter sp.]
GRRADRLEALVAELGGRATAAVFDLADPDATTAALAGLPGEFRNVSILVNNAGFGTDRGRAQDARLEDWDAMLAVNIRGLLHATHRLLPGMLERGRGQVINIGSVAGRAASHSNAVYSASKAFVMQFSKGLKSDLIGTPVRVAYVAPGAAETEFSLVRWQGDAGRAAAVYEGYAPLTAEDVAEAVMFCAAMPDHVDVTELELMPHAQGFGPRVLHRS